MAALEQEIAALRDEIQKLTSVTTKLLETRLEAIETVRSAAAPAAKPAKVSDEKKETNAEAKTAPVEKKEAPAEAKAAPVETPAADDELSDAGLKSHVAGYIGFGATDANPITQEERDARLAKVREVLAHEKIKAATVAEVPQNARKAFRKKIGDFIAEIQSNGPLTGGAGSDDIDEI